jgi:hypothetical protein
MVHFPFLFWCRLCACGRRLTALSITTGGFGVVRVGATSLGGLVFAIARMVHLIEHICIWHWPARCERGLGLRSCVQKVSLGEGCVCGRDLCQRIATGPGLARRSETKVAH